MNIESCSADYQAAFEPYFAAAGDRLQNYFSGMRPSLQRFTKPDRTQVKGSLLMDLKPHFVWLSQCFGITDVETISQVFEASILMEMHCCLQDRRIDHENRGMNYATSDSLSNILLADSLARFSAFARHPDFQRAVREAFCDLADAYIAEADGSLPYLSPEKMFQAVVNRAAPFHILVAALGHHTGKTDKIAPCSRMACHLILWFQILDDVTDWEQDLARKRYTYLLHRMRAFLPEKSMETWTRDDVANALFLFGGYESLIAEGIEHLGSALALAEAHAEPPALSDDPSSLRRWLCIFRDVHRSERQWSIDRKWAFLKTA